MLPSLTKETAQMVKRKYDKKNILRNVDMNQKQLIRAKECFPKYCC